MSFHDLSALPRPALQLMRDAGAEVLECRRALDKGGLNVVGEILRGQGEFIEYEHYPADDVHDADTHAQYYYHAHRGSEGEHGHFHTFLSTQYHAGLSADRQQLNIHHIRKIQCRKLFAGP